MRRTIARMTTTSQRLLLVNSGGEEAVPDWRRWLAEYAPSLEIQWWNDPAVRPEDVSYVIVWKPEPGRLATFPNLRLILSNGAGVDHIVDDPDWPSHLPIVRLAEPEGAQRMGEYVCLATLSLVKDMKRIVTAQAARHWDYFEPPGTAREHRAGVMGLGNLGTRAAEMLRDLGFPTAGWSRTPKSIRGVKCFAGAAALDAFLARTDILICLLPGSRDTPGIIWAETIAKLPRGAGIVNAARGSHVVTADLLAALDAGHLSGAFLDVFEQEPLPADHPLWTHPRVILTPHLAALASRRARARYFADIIAAFERGGALPNRYDPARGY
jgi:glyoxylate/hydroxypyruvate reductase